MIVKIYRFTTTYVLLQSTWETAQQLPWYVFDSFTYAQYAPTNEITMRGFKPSGFFIFLFFSCTFFILSLCLWFKENNKQPMSKVTITPPPRPGYSFRVTPRKPLDTDLFCFFLFSLFFFLSLLWMSKIGETHEQCTIERERKKPYQWIFLPLYVFSVFYWPWKFTNHFSHRLY